jgi:hypothetical protein
VTQQAITEAGLTSFLAATLRLPIADFSLAEASALALVPRDLAEKLQVFPICARKDGRVDVLVLAMADPTNLEAIDTIGFKTGRRIMPCIASTTALESAIRTHYYGERRREVQAQSPVQFGGSEVDLSSIEEPPTLDALAVDDDIPVITGVLSAKTNPGAMPGLANTGVIDLVDLELPAADPDVAFTAIQAPLSDLAAELVEGVPAPEMPPFPMGERFDTSEAARPAPEVAADAPNVRSTGSPATEIEMAKPTPEQLATAPFCPDCGATRMPGAKFCPHCGCSFTGATRAKGSLPATPPPTRPLMPASSQPVPRPITGIAPRIVVSMTPGGPIDIDALEGLRPLVVPGSSNVVQLRPRTASAANVDEVVQLQNAGDAHVGLGVTLLAQPHVTDACAPDEMWALTGGKRPIAPVVGAHLHRVSESMARIDDVDLLAPSNGAKPVSARASAPSPQSAPRAQVSSNGALPSLELLEGISRTSLLTSPSALCDDQHALAPAAPVAVPPFKLGLGVTHLGAFLADAALVDDVAVLRGEKAAPTRIIRATLELVFGAATSWVRVDDPNALAPKISLARDWADAAERPIPRMDDRANAPVPRQREVFLPPEDKAPPPPPPEPQVEYIPAPPVPAAAPAPWAAFATPPSGSEKPDIGAKPLSATAIVSLDALELRALAEKLVKSGAITKDDVDAAKKK